MNKEQGFTLLEIMVVCIIIAVATGALMFALPSSTQQAEMTQIEELLDNIRKARLIAHRYQQPIVLEIDKTGYRVLNVPPSEKNEPWSQEHQWGHAPLSITLQPRSAALVSLPLSNTVIESDESVQPVDATFLPPPSTLTLGPEFIIPEIMLRIVTTSKVWSLSNPGGGTFMEEYIP